MHQTSEHCTDSKRSVGDLETQKEKHLNVKPEVPNPQGDCPKMPADPPVNNGSREPCENDYDFHGCGIQGTDINDPAEPSGNDDDGDFRQESSESVKTPTSEADQKGVLGRESSTKSKSVEDDKQSPYVEETRTESDEKQFACAAFNLILHIAAIVILLLSLCIDACMYKGVKVENEGKMPTQEPVEHTEDVENDEQSQNQNKEIAGGDHHEVLKNRYSLSPVEHAELPQAEDTLPGEQKTHCEIVDPTDRDIDEALGAEDAENTRQHSQPDCLHHTRDMEKEDVTNGNPQSSSPQAALSKTVEGGTEYTYPLESGPELGTDTQRKEKEQIELPSIRPYHRLAEESENPDPDVNKQGQPYLGPDDGIVHPTQVPDQRQSRGNDGVSSSNTPFPGNSSPCPLNSAAMQLSTETSLATPIQQKSQPRRCISGAYTLPQRSVHRIYQHPEPTQNDGEAIELQGPAQSSNIPGCQDENVEEIPRLTQTSRACSSQPVEISSPIHAAYVHASHIQDEGPTRVNEISRLTQPSEIPVQQRLKDSQYVREHQACQRTILEDQAGHIHPAVLLPRNDLLPPPNRHPISSILPPQNITSPPHLHESPNHHPPPHHTLPPTLTPSPDLSQLPSPDHSPSPSRCISASVRLRQQRGPVPYVRSDDEADPGCVASTLTEMNVHLRPSRSHTRSQETPLHRVLVEGQPRTMGHVPYVERDGPVIDLTGRFVDLRNSNDAPRQRGSGRELRGALDLRILRGTEQAGYRYEHYPTEGSNLWNIVLAMYRSTVPPPGDAELCVECGERRPDVVLLNCLRHLVCLVCARQANVCPHEACGAPVCGYIRIY